MKDISHLQNPVCIGIAESIRECTRPAWLSCKWRINCNRSIVLRIRLFDVLFWYSLRTRTRGTGKSSATKYRTRTSMKWQQWTWGRPSATSVAKFKSPSSSRSRRTGSRWEPWTASGPGRIRTLSGWRPAKEVRRTSGKRRTSRRVASYYYWFHDFVVETGLNAAARRCCDRLRTTRK